MSAHSGPWRIADDDAGHSLSLRDADYQLIARLPWREPCGRHALIAAAPKLLDMVKRLADNLGFSNDTDDSALCCEARALIAKVEG